MRGVWLGVMTQRMTLISPLPFQLQKVEQSFRHTLAHVLTYTWCSHTRCFVCTVVTTHMNAQVHIIHTLIVGESIDSYASYIWYTCLYIPRRWGGYISMYMYITSGLVRKGWVWVGSSHRHTNVNIYRRIDMVHGQCGISNCVNSLIGPSANSLPATPQPQRNCPLNVL